MKHKTKLLAMAMTAVMLFTAVSLASCDPGDLFSDTEAETTASETAESLHIEPEKSPFITVSVSPVTVSVTNNQPTLKQTLTATIQPATTENKEVDWTVAWADSTGADVTFTAVPTEYQPGMGATLLVMLGDRQAASVPCVWDGTVFRGTANLNAADGYSYFCLLSGPNGVQQLSLMGPESENAGIPVYLQSALSSYCNLLVSDWVEQNGSSLILNGAYAQVQLPQIQGQELTFVTQELVLRLNGPVSAKVPIVLSPSEVAGSYEVIINNLHLPMPELDDSDNLELYLEITLSDGRHLQAFGIGWYLENGKLSASVG